MLRKEKKLLVISIDKYLINTHKKANACEDMIHYWIFRGQTSKETHVTYKLNFKKFSKDQSYI
jgi:hypothetical protein